MARFERSNERGGKRDSNNNYPKRENRGKRSFEGRSNGGRAFTHNNNNKRDKRDFEMTKVTCSSCGVECEVPFKPTSNKPVYCDNCFSKKDKVSSDKHSNLDIINEKLDKIMKALKIE